MDVERVVDGGFAVAAVGGDCTRGATEPGFDAFDGGGQQRRVGRVADVHAVVHDDAVAVVDDLGDVAELDGPTESSFHDRSGVGVVQRHDPRRAGHGLTAQTGAGLRRDPLDQIGDPFQLGHRGAGCAGRLGTLDS